MNILKRFGSGSRLYTFPTNSQVTYSDNFASLVTKTVRLAGVNGGFSNLGSGRGLSPIGTVRIDLWLKDFVGSDATDKVNSLRQMTDWGVQMLVRQPVAGAEQFCMARVTDISRQEDVHNVPFLRQKVSVVFEVTDPFWYRTVSGFGVLWDDNSSQWDDLITKWDAVNTYAVTNSATWTFSNSGNYYILPRIQVINSSGSSVSNIRIRRIVDGNAENDFRFSAALATGSYLDIDPVRRRVRIQPANTNALDWFEAKTPDWMRLLPGSNSLLMTCTGTIAVSLSYLERFI